MNENTTNGKSGPGTGWPFVSVVVVTKGHHEDAESAVASIAASDHPGGPPEIVVIEETDSPRPIAFSFVKYYTIPVRNLGVGFARNEALKHASGEIIAFTDDDCIVDKSWLREIVKPLVERPDAEATAGAVLVPECGPVGKCENILGFPGGGVRYLHAAAGKITPMATFSTCNCAVRKSLKHTSFQFHEGFTYAGEDELLSRAISERSAILYNPAARVFHKPKDSLAGVFKWFIRRGQASVEILRREKYRNDMVLYRLYSSIFLRLLIAVGVCVALDVSVPSVLAGLFLLYFLLVIWRYRWALAYHPDWRALAVLPFVKLTMDAGMDIGIIKTFLSRPGSS
jgi:glycosyltransferase involved in cell wall biosynthesis